MAIRPRVHYPFKGGGGGGGGREGEKREHSQRINDGSLLPPLFTLGVVS